MRITKLTKCLLTFSVAAIVAASAHAQQYPSRTIKIIVGFGAGGTADAISRYYALKLSEVLKVPVIIDNKPGAGQILAIKSVMASPPDGYTLFVGTGSALSQGPGFRNDLPYDPLKDFSLIGLVASAPGVIVINPQLPVRSLGDLVKYSKANPSALNYGSSGIGSASHLQTEYLISTTGMKMTHIPYKSDADIMREVSLGSVHMGLSTMQGAFGSISNGRVRALAVTGSKRLKELPDVASLSETDFKGLAGIDIYSYYGLVGPVGLPPAVVAKLNDAINTVSKTPEVIAQVQDRLFAEPGVSTPESFRKYIQNDLERWKSFGKHVKLDK